MEKKKINKAKKVVVVEESPEVQPVVPQAPMVEVPQESVEEEAVVEEKNNYLWIIIPTALLVGAFVGGLITYFSGISKMNTSDEIAVEDVSTPEPDVTPSAEVDNEVNRTGIKLQVLNGSGISGVAGKAKIMLEDLGYEDVAVGNADTSNYKNTEIQIKDDYQDYLQTLIDDLSADYTVSDKTETLPASSKYDAVIILGSE